MTRRNLDLWLVVIAAMVGLAAQVPGLPAAVKVTGGLVLVVLCPGYALAMALFPGDSLGWPERGVLSLSLSFGCAMLGAVIFNWFPQGLQTNMWAGLTSGLTLEAALIAAARRRRGSAPASSIMRLPRAPAAKHWPLLGLAGLLTVGALIWVRAPRPTTGVLGYTQLWMLADAQNANRINLGITSSEFTISKYRLTLALDGQVLLDEPEITLSPGDKWQRSVDLPASLPTGLLEASLYRQDNPSFVYRWVTLQRNPLVR